MKTVLAHLRYYHVPLRYLRVPLQSHFVPFSENAYSNDNKLLLSSSPLFLWIDRSSEKKHFSAKTLTLCNFRMPWIIFISWPSFPLSATHVLCQHNYNLHSFLSKYLQGQIWNWNGLLSTSHDDLSVTPQKSLWVVFYTFSVVYIDA